ncbi:CHAT domain-containing tetratricopeptide repeat protein [Roseofilum casamattae]|uniref:CHAT domain-containing protein n=1 Tax=Roseofilum casamattae BLCC-M143 TaxID=3022442 RepID=A0ABT7BV76_9CYAN|nr:CHAT domain-containing protein [Roseofilum casamattae]MDJ1183099.1 CHAT domain-containing protein [Roseofilum casamattae BLCC-M143]
MNKLVSLALEGDPSTSDLRVTLEIGSEEQPRQIQQKGELPQFSRLYASLTQWIEDYHRLGLDARIEPGKIVYDGSITHPIEQCRESARQLQHDFQQWLRSPSFQDLDRRLREELTRDDNIRFLIRTEVAALHKLPWHSWDIIERYRNAEIGLSQISFEACHQQQKTSPTPVRILAILGDSRGIEVDRDLEILRALPHAEINFLVEPQRHELSDRLWSQPWDIIFFAGHSRTEGETGHIYINPDDALPLEELWYGLRQAVRQGLQLAIFNSCDGLGLAGRLDDPQIPVTIVMRELVPDAIAQEFLKSFLSAFARGQSLYLSMREAREKLQGWEDRYPCASWLPIIYQHPNAIPPTWRDLCGIGQSDGNSDIGDRSIPVPAPNVSAQHPRWRSPKERAAATIGILTYLLFTPWLSMGVHQLVKHQYQNANHGQAQWLNNIVIAIAPWRTAPYYNRALFCWQEKRDDAQCLRDYERAAKFGYSDAKAQAAYLNIRIGDWVTAKRWIADCLDNPMYAGTEAACWKNRGWLLQLQGHPDAAKEALETALETYPESPHAACLLAQIWEEEGDDAKALDYWSQSLSAYEQKSERAMSEEDSECFRSAKSRLKLISRK